MFNFLRRRSSKTNSLDMDFFHRMNLRHPQPRNSSERQAINPLLDEEGTDERRYYRSAEFQQALIEDQIERNLTPSVEQTEAEEDTGRISRFVRRSSTVLSKSSLTLPCFDQDMERAQQENRNSQIEEEEGVQSSAYNLDIPSTRHAPDSAAVSSDGSTASEPSRSSSRPRIHRHGISPLINFARNRKE